MQLIPYRLVDKQFWLRWNEINETNTNENIIGHLWKSPDTSQNLKDQNEDVKINLYIRLCQICHAIRGRRTEADWILGTTVLDQNPETESDHFGPITKDQHNIINRESLGAMEWHALDSLADRLSLQME